MKRLLIPLAAACLSATALAFPAQAAPHWVKDPLTPQAKDAYGAAAFWLDANGAALKKASHYHWDAKKVDKIVRKGGSKPDDGKPGATAPTKTGSGGKTKNVNLPRTIGKVFFIDKAGNHKWCSGTSIQSRHRNLVVTAGHCVYEQGDDVFAKWVFVPGYYQGKAPYGIYVGAYAFTHYDLDTYDDFDGDYAFVAVHNGFKLAGEKEVTQKEYNAWAGDKWIKPRELTREEFRKCQLNLGHCWSEGKDTKSQLVGPDHPDAVLEKDEVSPDAYKKARTGRGQGHKYGEPVTESVTAKEYNAYKGPGTKAKDKAGNLTITRYYVQKWVKPGDSRKYFEGRFVIGVAKDTGRLGDAVGGQGFAWNQPMNQQTMVFGYPAAPHPDGDKPFSGVTPKYCAGKTGTKTIQANMFKVETHQVLKCSMTPGADGGPWLIKWNNAKRTGYVNGVTSVFYDNDGNDRVDHVSSAYFDGETADVYNKANYAQTKAIVGPNGELLQ